MQDRNMSEMIEFGGLLQNFAGEFCGKFGSLIER